MIKLLVDESRRLTGPNVLSDYPGAVMEVYIEGVAHQTVIDTWKKHLLQLLEKLELSAEIQTRIFSDGVNLGFLAEEDMLYTACEINEAALELTRADLTGKVADESLTNLVILRQNLKEERNPQLLNLIQLANNNQVSYLVDDDEFSLGMGKHSSTWPVSQLPDPASLSWSDYQNIPVALITGTNGKSTSVRMCDAIVKASGVTAGITSTDYIRAGEIILD